MIIQYMRMAGASVNSWLANVTRSQGLYDSNGLCGGNNRLMKLFLVFVPSELCTDEGEWTIHVWVWVLSAAKKANRAPSLWRAKWLREHSKATAEQWRRSRHLVTYQTPLIREAATAGKQQQVKMAVDACTLLRKIGNWYAEKGALERCSKERTG